jgi:hypothetical protein
MSLVKELDALNAVDRYGLISIILCISLSSQFQIAGKRIMHVLNEIIFHLIYTFYIHYMGAGIAQSV